jgi:DNA-binding NarL/FixJ family response regulator
LLLLDLFLGDRDGLHLVKDFSARFPTMRILSLMITENEDYTERLIRAGAAGYLVTSARVSEVVEAVRTIAAGGTYPAGCGFGVKGRHRRCARDDTAAGLTDREIRVFHLIGLRYGTGRIAELLGLSRKTIETYREHIKNKLGFADGAALKQGAINWLETARDKDYQVVAKRRNFPQISGKTPDVRPLSVR